MTMIFNSQETATAAHYTGSSVNELSAV